MTPIRQIDSRLAYVKLVIWFRGTRRGLLGKSRGPCRFFREGKLAGPRGKSISVHPHYAAVCFTSIRLIYARGAGKAVVVVCVFFGGAFRMLSADMTVW